MQVLFPGRTERLWSEFKDDNYNLVNPDGVVRVDIQYQDGSYVVTNGQAVNASLGLYYYEYTPSAAYGYYGVWWTATIDGIVTTQDLPNPFVVEDTSAAVYKSKFVEGIRSKLYMHFDSGGFVNKFPRNREIIDLMQNSLDWINAHPPVLTAFSFANLPNQFHHLLEQGVVVLALQSLGILEAGKHFTYNDNGIAISRDRSIKYQSLYASVVQQYATLLKSIKTKYALDNVNMSGMFSSTTGYPRSLSRALRGVSKFST